MKKSQFFYAGILATFLFVAFFAPYQAHAQVFSGIAAGGIGAMILVLSQIISVIAGIIVAVITWALQVMLQINIGVVNSPVVRYGFPVMLSIANLGFVLGIIVIGIATILRDQTYGIGKLLGKLVIMAVVINFGLVLTGGILNFFDQTSVYFLNQISPPIATGGLDAVANFASAIGGSFNPQKAEQVDTSNITETVIANLQAMFSPSVALSNVLKPISALIFSILSSLIVIVTLGVLVAMLLVRYVELGALLVLLPLAWLAWVFPALKEHFNKWWGKFIKQASFPPIVIFFLWLALTTSKEIQNKIGGWSALTLGSVSNANGAAGAITGFFSGVFLPIIDHFMSTVVLGGLMMGGIIAASTLSIKFADVADKAVTGIKDWGIGKVSRVGKRAITRPVRGAGVQKTADEWIKSGNYAQRILGRGMKAFGRVGGQDLVTQQAASISKMSTQQALEELQAPVIPNSQERKMALLEKLQKDNALGRIANMSKFVSKDNKDAFERMNQGKLYSTLYSESGMQLKDMVLDPVRAKKKAEAEVALKAATTPQETQKAKEELLRIDDNLIKYFRTSAKPEQLTHLFGDYDENDPNKKPPLGMSGDELEKIRQITVQQAASTLTPPKLAAMVRKMTEGGDDRYINNFQKTAKTIIDKGGEINVNEANEKWLETSPSSLDLGLGMEFFAKEKKPTPPPPVDPVEEGIRAARNKPRTPPPPPPKSSTP